MFIINEATQIMAFSKEKNRNEIKHSEPCGLIFTTKNTKKTRSTQRKKWYGKKKPTKTRTHLDR